MFSQARLGNAVDAARCLPLVDEIASSVFRNPGALVSLARLKSRDDYTYMHSVAVCALMVSLGRQLVQSGHLELGDGPFPTLGLSALGVEALRNRTPIMLTKPIVAPSARPAKQPAAAAGVIACDEALLARLKVPTKQGFMESSWHIEWAPPLILRDGGREDHVNALICEAPVAELL